MHPTSPTPTRAAPASPDVFRAMADVVPAMLWQCEADGTCIFVNALWCRVTGQREDEALGHGWLDAVHPDDRAATNAGFAAAVASGAPTALEYRVRQAGGGWRWCLDTVAPRHDADGRVIGYVGSVVDIHERHELAEARAAAIAALEAQAVELLHRQGELQGALARAERAEAEARRRGDELLELADNLPQLAWMTDAAGRSLWYNRRMERFTGLTNAQLRDSPWRAILHPDDADAVVARFDAAVASGEPWEDTFRVRGADGGYRWFLSRANPIRADGPDGRPGPVVRWFGTNTDVTAEREADDDRDFLVAVGAALQEPSAALDVARLAVRQVAERLGLARCVWGAPDLDGDGAPAIVAEWARPGLPSHLGLQPQGDDDPTAPPPPDAPVPNEQAGWFTDDVTTAPEFPPARAAYLLGLGVRAIATVPLVRDGRWMASLIASHDAPYRWTPRARRLLQAVADRAWAAYEQRQALAAAERERRRLAAVLDAIPVGVVIAGGDGVLHVATAEARRLWRIAAASDALPGHVRDYVRLHGVDRETGRPLAADEWPLAHAVGRGEARTRLLVLGPAGHEQATALVSAAPIREADGRVAGGVAVLTDVTARETLEERLRQAQKMEAVGQLAGGIAHDFNNLLTVIAGNLEFVRGALDAAHPVQDDLAEIGGAAERARALVRQLLAFSRKQTLRPQRVDVNAVVLGAERLLRRVIGEEIALDVRLGEPSGIVRADPMQIEQVLLNLAVNARDAMLDGARAAGASVGMGGTGGTLTLETRTTELTAREAAAWDGLAPGPVVEIVVRDTGMGMDAATRARAFEPFFTTKPVGAGTGLGLATVLGIVQQSGGAIRLESAPGAGATFTLRFPRAADEPTPADGEAPPGTVGGAGTVLVVEDEAAVRVTTRRMLERHGWRVLEAADGAEALEAWAGCRGRVDAVVTDLRMPTMGGRELAARLRAERPGLPVVFVSGYADVAATPAGVPGEAVVEKPFSSEALLAALTRAREAAPR